VTEIIINPGDNSLILTGISKGLYFVRYSSKDGNIRNSDRMIVY
jgi:hypothetical protein